MRKLAWTFVILIIGVIGLGLYLHWFDPVFSRNAQGDKKLTLGVEVDPEKIKEDTEAAKQKAQEIGRTVRKNADALAGAETVKGTVVKVDETDHRFTVMTAESKEVTMEMDPSSKVRLKNAEVPLKDLREGDQVTVSYKVKDGKNMVQSVTIERAT